MTEEDVKIIADAVERYMAELRKPGRTGSFFVCDYESFRRMICEILTYPKVPAVADRCCRASAQDEFLAVAAMCALRPWKTGAPPSGLRVALTFRIKEILGSSARGTGRFGRVLMPSAGSCLVFTTATAAERDQSLEDFVFDIAIAFGCGKWRIPARGPASGPALWETQWFEAHSALVSLVEKPVKQVLPWLATTRPDFPNFLPGPELDRAATEAAFLVVGRLLAPSTTHELVLESDGHSLSCLVDGAVWFGSGGLTVGARMVVGDCHGGQVFRPPGSPCFEIPAGGKLVVFVRAGGALLNVAWVGRGSQIQVESLDLGVNDPAVVKLRSGTLLNCGCGRLECFAEHSLAGWDLSRYSLASCAEVAVKGPRTGLDPISFDQGLFGDIIANGWP